MRQKYGNKRVGKYASKKEAKHAVYLHALQVAGKISLLQEQVTFTLIPSQTMDGKVIERAWTYKADFTYMDEAGNFHVVDVKGFRTPEYIAKRKAMLFCHGIRIEEV